MCRRVHSYFEGRLVPADQHGLVISSTAAKRVLRDGESLLYEDCADDDVLAAAESVVAMNLRSIICVPLRAKSRILGILYIDTDRADRRYGQEDLLLAAAVGNSAGIALDNVFMHRQLLEKQRMEQEIETAWAIQDGFLCRDWDTHDPRFEVYGDTLPAKTVGGDFYDFVRIGADKASVLIGDVSGKGVPAALTMAQLLAEFRLLARDIASPAEIIARLNANMTRRSRRGMFCTLCCAQIDLGDGQLVWANAGHLPAVLIGKDGNAFIGEASGPPVGIVDEAAWPEESRRLLPGETVLYCTDGILEARPAGPNAAEFGLERLRETPRPGMTPQSVLNALVAAVSEHLRGADAHDDRTMIALRYLGHEH